MIPEMERGTEGKKRLLQYETSVSVSISSLFMCCRKTDYTKSAVALAVASSSWANTVPQTCTVERVSKEAVVEA